MSRPSKWTDRVLPEQVQLKRLDQQWAAAKTEPAAGIRGE